MSAYALNSLQWLTDRFFGQIKGCQPLKSIHRISRTYHHLLSNLHSLHRLKYTMAPISTSFSTYPTPGAFFESSPASASPTFSIGKAVYAGAAAFDTPTPVPSMVTSALPGPPDTGLHQFLLYMAILGAVFFFCMAYVVAKPLLIKWRGKQEEDDDDDEQKFSKSPSFSPPSIALPPRSATYGRAEVWMPPQRPAYISQADMLSSGRGFFG
ncbi:hypothetical protein B0H12DRAFT_501055 [Mycena haematopus]|nr:hypothetical protein B0H12DRAFT_501055 [Mycena haematopus]